MGDGAKFGEGLSVGGRSEQDPKARGLSKMVLGVVGMLLAAVLGYMSFDTFISGYQEYTASETLGVADDLSTAASVPHAAKPSRQMYGYLSIEVTHPDGTKRKFGPYHNLIVNTGENFLVDAFQNLTEPELFRYHGIGTSTTAPAETDTGCGTELTTQYNPDNTRATGTLTEGAATNIFRTVATNTVDATVTIGEFCLMSQAATGGGTMWSRVLVSPTVGLNSGDSIQTTYDLTVE